MSHFSDSTTVAPRTNGLVDPYRFSSTSRYKSNIPEMCFQQCCKFCSEERQCSKDNNNKISTIVGEGDHKRFSNNNETTTVDQDF